MFLDEISEEKRREIGKIIVNMKLERQKLRNFLYVIDEDDSVIAERIDCASDFDNVFKMYIAGENIEYIAESVFQSDKKIIIQILDVLGIEHNNGA